MAKEPARRYQTAQELADDLKRFMNGQPIVARPVGPVERAWRWTKRNSGIAALWTGLVLALSIGLAGVTWQWQRAERQREARASPARGADEHLQRCQRRR